MTASPARARLFYCSKSTVRAYTVKSAANLIADAILNEPQAAQFVARFLGNNLEIRPIPP